MGGVVFAGVLDPVEGEDESDQAEGQVEEEDPVPAIVSSDEAADGGTEDERGEAGPGDVGDGLGELVLGGSRWVGSWTGGSGGRPRDAWGRWR